jgi:predicted DNA-binding ribbon-helix-helix protein
MLKQAGGDRVTRPRTTFIVAEDGKKKLRNFNIYVGDKRTSVRLSPTIANAIEKIAARERCDLDELYTHINRTKERGVSRSTAIRDFALRYFMEADTNDGHRRAGHGKLISSRKRRPRRAREQD